MTPVASLASGQLSPELRLMDIHVKQPLEVYFPDIKFQSQINNEQYCGRLSLCDSVD